MKKREVKTLLKKTSAKIGGILLATALVFGGSLYVDTTRTFVPELVTFVDTEEVVEITEDETPLAAPKVTISTKTKKNTKNIKLKKASAKTYKKTSKTKTKKSTKTTKSANATTKTQTVTATSVVDQFKKGSKVDKRTTTVKTTVTKTVTTVQPQATTTSQTTQTTAAANASNVSVASIAPKVDARVAGAFQKLGFFININSGVSYSGLFDARNRTITLKRADDTVYHELGHFLAFVAGNVDVSSQFISVYNSEKSKYTAYNKSYVLSSSSEYFAESFKNYTLDPAGLKASRPQTYAAIQSALARVTDSQVAKVWSVYGAIWK